MYIGANTLAAPIATPPVIRAAMKYRAELAAPCCHSGPQKYDCVHEHRRSPPESIGQPACAEGANRAAKQYRGNCEARACGIGAKGFPQSINRPVNDAAIEAKEEASDRRYAA